MGDYISRETAIDRFQSLAYDDWNQGASTTWANAYTESADIIEQIPASDVVDVVRCGDCQYFEQGAYEDHWCLFWESLIKENDFCSRGERREDGD